MFKKMTNASRPRIDPATVTLITAMRSADRDLMVLRQFIDKIGFNAEAIVKDAFKAETAFVAKDAALQSLVFHRDFKRANLESAGLNEAADWLDSITKK
jgi:hypothetical protein